MYLDVQQGGVWLLQIPSNARGEKADSRSYTFYFDRPLHTESNVCCVYSTLQITDWMVQAVKNYPEVVTIVEYGQTYEKRNISLLKVNQLFDSLCEKHFLWRIIEP